MTLLCATELETEAGCHPGRTTTDTREKDLEVPTLLHVPTEMQGVLHLLVLQGSPRRDVILPSMCAIGFERSPGAPARTPFRIDGRGVGVGVPRFIELEDLAGHEVPVPPFGYVPAAQEAVPRRSRVPDPRVRLTGGGGPVAPVFRTENLQPALPRN